MTIVASFFVTYVCEIIPEIYLGSFKFVYFVLISIILRSFASFLIVCLISSHTTKYGYDKYYFSSDKDKSRTIKLFVISAPTTAFVIFWPFAFNLNYDIINALLNSTLSTIYIYPLPISGGWGPLTSHHIDVFTRQL